MVKELKIKNVKAIKTNYLSWVVVANAFNPNTWRQRKADFSEFEVSLVYEFQDSQTTQRDSIYKKQK